MVKTILSIGKPKMPSQHILQYRHRFNSSMIILILLLSINSIPLSSTIKLFKCEINLEPNDIIANQIEYSEELSYNQFRCEATLERQTLETFSNPVFDVTFGVQGINGMYMIRERGDCNENKLKCWKNFTIPAYALRFLISNPLMKEEGNKMKMKYVSNLSSRIIYSCALTDTSSNSKKPIHCDKVGRVLFGKVLNYGESCETKMTDGNDRIESMDQCGQHMMCLADNDRSKLEMMSNNVSLATCRCQEGYFAYKFTATKTVCLETTKLWGKCNLSIECQAYDPNTLCELDTSIGHNVCKCLGGYESKVNASSKESKEYYCEKIKEKYFDDEHDKESNPICPPSYRRNSNADSIIDDNQLLVEEQLYNNTLPINQNLKNFQISSTGIYILLSVVLASAIIVAIIIRNKRHGILQMETNGAKQDKMRKKANGSNNLSNAKHAPLLAIMNKLNEDDEDIDITIDDTNADDSGDNLTSPYKNGHNNHWNLEMENGNDYQLDEVDDENGRDPSNFNYNAKQSTV